MLDSRSGSPTASACQKDRPSCVMPILSSLLRLLGEQLEGTTYIATVVRHRLPGLILTFSPHPGKGRCNIELACYTLLGNICYAVTAYRWRMALCSRGRLTSWQGNTR